MHTISSVYISAINSFTRFAFNYPWLFLYLTIGERQHKFITLPWDSFRFYTCWYKKCTEACPLISIWSILHFKVVYTYSVLLFTYKLLKLLQPWIILMINPLAMWQEIYLLWYWLSTIIYNLNIYYQNSNHIFFTVLYLSMSKNSAITLSLF